MFLSGTNLETSLRRILGKDFQLARIKQASYELSLGSEVYLTDSKDRKVEILDDKNKIVEINAGQLSVPL